MPYPATEQRKLLSDLRLSTEYRTSESDLVAEFYRPCLSASREYWRAAGFFRSSVLTLIGRDLVEFAVRGGAMRLICSPRLTDEDRAALESGYSQMAQVETRLLEDLASLLAEPYSAAKARALATLVACGALEVRVALRQADQGIYHEKLGAFEDESGALVTFRGSSNESWSGWHEKGNLESFEVFCSWSSRTDAERTWRHRSYLERLWNGLVQGVRVVEFPVAVRERLLEVAYPEPEAIDLLELDTGNGARAYAAKLRPLPHQEQALASWKEMGRRGILQHATGSGKTLTALMALREHLAQGGVGLVVVPTRLLLRQWAREIKREIPDAVVLLAGDQHVEWKKKERLERFVRNDPSLGNRLVLATLQTASTALFRAMLRDGEHLLLVVDEVHTAGSRQFSSLLDLSAASRLGLSATPIRFGDPDGTRLLFDYFGEVIEPVVTLRDAIAAGRLVPYEYYPEVVRLTDDESDEWVQLTEKLRREIGRSATSGDERASLSERARQLMMKRSRIAKKAVMKIPLALDIVQREYQRGDSWLIYCDDQEQVGSLLGELRERGLQALEYHTGMRESRHDSLDWFTRFGGLLLSIRCLDEGVDIPVVNRAIVLASSQNPRQFIQRRGRVLRRSPGKYRASIWDALVLPRIASEEPEKRVLILSELRRAVEFARDAVNRSALARLQQISSDAGLTVSLMAGDGIDQFVAEGLEEDSDGN